jgi:hypothetical protein
MLSDLKRRRVSPNIVTTYPDPDTVHSQLSSLAASSIVNILSLGRMTALLRVTYDPGLIVGIGSNT